MIPSEPLLAPQAMECPPRVADTSPGSESSGWFQNRYTQSVPAESLSVNEPPNDWSTARAATEQLGDGKEWTPRSPPQLIVSIIGQLLKLLPDPPQPSPNATDKAADKREVPSATPVLSASANEPKAYLQNHNDAAIQTFPPAHAHDAASHKYAYTKGSTLRPIPGFAAPGTPVSMKICYSEYPSILIVQTRDFQPHVQVRRSSQPAVHIYSRFPLRIDDQFDALAKRLHFPPLDRLPGEPPRNDEAEEEGLINPYIRQKQPTVFFHYDGRDTSRGVSSNDGQPWQPHICIDTTSLWWPSIQCAFANPSATPSTDGFNSNSYGHNYTEAAAPGISISGPVKPLSMDLPY